MHQQLPETERQFFRQLQADRSLQYDGAPAPLVPLKDPLWQRAIRAVIDAIVWPLR